MKDSRRNFLKLLGAVGLTAALPKAAVSQAVDSLPYDPAAFIPKPSPFDTSKLSATIRETLDPKLRDNIMRSNLVYKKLRVMQSNIRLHGGPMKLPVNYDDGERP